MVTLRVLTLLLALTIANCATTTISTTTEETEPPSAACPEACTCTTDPNRVAKCESLGDEPFGRPILHLKLLQPRSSLSIGHQHFKKLGLDKLNSITITDGQIDKISKTAFEGLSELTIVKIVNSNVTYIHPDSFTGNTNLRKLILSGNPISDTAFLQKTSVDEIDLSNTNIEEITPDTFANLDKLRVLNLNNNGIEKIAPHSFDSLKSLEEVHLSSNQITSLPSDFFQNNEILTVLDLSKNPLMSFENNVIPSLEELSLKSCNLTKITPSMFTELHELSVLDLSDNAIEDISPFSFRMLPSLEILNLEGNRLRSLPADVFQENTELKKITLDNNPDLRSLPKNGFTAIDGDFKTYSFSCSNCGLRELTVDTFSKMPALVTLNLANNELHSVQDVFAGLSSLLELDLSHNLLSTIQESLTKNTNLRSLKLAGNMLLAIYSFDFEANKVLETLDVSACGLTKLWTDPVGFSVDSYQLSSLSYLNASHNLIEAITAKEMEVTKNLRVLDINANPLRCNVDLKELIVWLGDRSVAPAMNDEIATHVEMVTGDSNDEYNDKYRWEALAKKQCSGGEDFEEEDWTEYEEDDDDDEEDTDEDDSDDSDDDDDLPLEFADITDKVEVKESTQKKRPYRYSYLWPIIVFICTTLAVMGIVVNVILLFIRHRRNIRMPFHIHVASAAKLKKNSGLVYHQLSEERGGPRTPIISRAIIPTHVPPLKSDKPVDV